MKLIKLLFLPLTFIAFSTALVSCDDREDAIEDAAEEAADDLEDAVD